MPETIKTPHRGSYFVSGSVLTIQVSGKVKQTGQGPGCFHPATCQIEKTIVKRRQPLGGGEPPVEPTRTCQAVVGKQRQLLLSCDSPSRVFRGLS